MSKGDPSEEGAEAPALPRLPPGRHGLPRDFVVKNQKDRLASGIISTIAEHGYNDTTITQIVEAAGVSRRTFYTYFSSKEECYADTWKMIASFMRGAAAEEAAPHDDWPDKVRARLAAALETFAANPDLARFVLIAPLRAGNVIAERYRSSMELVLSQLIEGLPDDADRPSQAVQLAVIGGTVSLVVQHVEAGKGESLPEILPDLVELVLAPYLGREEATRLARSGT